MEDNIGMKITALRNYLGLSITVFARQIHISESHLRKLENNVYAVKKPIVETICSVFDVDPSYFNSDVPVSGVSNWANIHEKYDGLKLPERIRKLRKENHMTQVELAEKSGASQSVISAAESGAQRLTEKQAEKIAAALEVGSDYLLYGDLTKKNYPVNDEMIDWLWKHEEEREVIWRKMHRK